jgi:hypothetical protein
VLNETIDPYNDRVGYVVMGLQLNSYHLHADENNDAGHKRMKEVWISKSSILVPKW